MLDSLRNAQHVLRIGDKVEILSYNNRRDLMARFEYPTRPEALRALEQITGKRVTLRPMQTQSAELVETGEEILEELPDE